MISEIDVSAGQAYINERLNVRHIVNIDIDAFTKKIVVSFEDLKHNSTKYTQNIELIEKSFLVKPQGLKTHLILNSFSILDYKKYKYITRNTAIRKKDRKTKVECTEKGDIIVSDVMNNYKSRLTPISDQHEEKTIVILNTIEAMQRLKDKL